jgi:putative ABC transport system substrate-binding protein
MLSQLQAASQSRNIGLRLAEVRTRNDIEPAFKALGRDRVEALLVNGTIPFLANRRIITDLAERQRLPVVGALREFAEEGALASYGPNLASVQRQAATYVDRILKGAKPADLPMERPSTFELVINLKTAKRLGLTIPEAVRLRATDVVE